MKVHRIASGIRGVFGREWHAVWTACGLRMNVDPPSKRPKLARGTWSGVDCLRCLKARKR